MNTAFPFPLLVRLDPPTCEPAALRVRRTIDFALEGGVSTRAWFCHHCDFAPSGAPEGAVLAAIDAHWRYLNAHADRATDPHFDEARLDALLA